YFNFKVEVRSDGWTYWTDSMQVIVTGVEEETTLPTEFSLEQNYPNPFNPSTKIKYSVPQLSKVVIKVFDILGNEIETLINEEKPAGEYNVDFRIDNLELPSGIYFYRLQAGEFIQVKKMILLK
ncbi:MAG: T9SS type A sorting domain-containing protein, partial [Ignavibacteriaceae bacterium]